MNEWVVRRARIRFHSGIKVFVYYNGLGISVSILRYDTWIQAIKCSPINDSPECAGEKELVYLLFCVIDGRRRGPGSDANMG